jgi:hypothetical protein
MEDVDIFYGHLVHFRSFCYILWTFGIVRGNLVYISRFGIFGTKKNLATLGRKLFFCLPPLKSQRRSATATEKNNNKFFLVQSLSQH